MRKLLYYNSIKNFGDELNITLLENLFYQDVKKGDVFDSDLIMIGSILEKLTYSGFHPRLILKKFKNTPINIFGTGFMFPERGHNKKLYRNVNVHAVRGYYSKQRLEKILNKKLKNTVIGDPGLLCKYLLDKKYYEKRYEIGIIPHYIDKDLPIIKELLNIIPGATLINIQSDSIEVLKKISNCKTIISSAMHGLIAADSLNIPNLRIILSDNISGGNYKFNDYYSAIGVNNHKFIDLTFFYELINLKYLPDFIYENYMINSDLISEINENLIIRFKKINF